jgi:hypothetical protein
MWKPLWALCWKAVAVATSAEAATRVAFILKYYFCRYGFFLVIEWDAAERVKRGWECKRVTRHRGLGLEDETVGTYRKPYVAKRN